MEKDDSSEYFARMFLARMGSEPTRNKRKLSRREKVQRWLKKWRRLLIVAPLFWSSLLGIAYLAGLGLLRLFPGDDAWILRLVIMVGGWFVLMDAHETFLKDKLIAWVTKPINDYYDKVR